VELIVDDQMGFFNCASVDVLAGLNEELFGVVLNTYEVGVMTGAKNVVE